MVPDGLDSKLFGEAKVEHFDDAVLRDLDIGGLEIAMDDTFLVCRVQRVGNLPGQTQSFSEKDRPRGDSFR